MEKTPGVAFSLKLLGDNYGAKYFAMMSSSLLLHTPRRAMVMIITETGLFGEPRFAVRKYGFSPSATCAGGELSAVNSMAVLFTTPLPTAD
jgi:hypothetical protein